MKFGVLGSGVVGQTLANGLLRLGFRVKIGTNHAEKLKEWLENAGEKASAGSFSDAAMFGDFLVLAVKGSEVENIIESAGRENFSDKIVIDVTNPLVMKENSKVPTMGVGFPDSLGGKIQDILPTAKVVKAFNTVPAHYMTNPRLEEGTPDLFIAGNDFLAKKAVEQTAEKWGWRVIDVGGIDKAHLLESLAMLWITLGFKDNYWQHAFKLLMK